MAMQSRPCVHNDVKNFDGTLCCFACGEFGIISATTLRPKGQGRSEYVYTELKSAGAQEIRLVRLCPGDYTDPLRCTVEHQSLSKSPHYDAVSYTWATEDGDDSKTQQIFTVDNKFLYITKNCEAALQLLRHTSESRLIWIDSISIDQTNTKERNHQVGIMGQIYQKAYSVRICIPDPKNDYSSCMDWLHQRNRNRDHNRNHSDLMFTPVNVNVPQQLIRLFELRYFTRVWVLQEVALASSPVLNVNGVTATLSNYCMGLLQYRAFEWGIKIPGPLQWLHTEKLAVGIIPWLRVAWECKSRDPRDKVFAILSLLQPSNRELIPVDYSLSLGQVITNAIWACIVDSQSLAILLYVRLQDKATSGINFTPENFAAFLEQKIPHGSVYTKYTYTRNINKALRIDLSSVRMIGGPACGLPFLHADMSDNQTPSTPLSTYQLLPRLLVRGHLIDILLGLNLADPFELRADLRRRDSVYMNAHYGQLLKRFLSVEPPKGEQPPEPGAKYPPRRNYFERLPGYDTILEDCLERDFSEYCMEDLETFARIAGELSTGRNCIFATFYSAGLSSGVPSLKDAVFGIDGTDGLFLLREVEQSVYRVVGTCYVWAAWELDSWNTGSRKGIWWAKPGRLGTHQSRMIEIF